MIQIDHIGITAHDALASARLLAEILGAMEPAVEGADGDMYRVDLAHGTFLVFSSSDTVSFEHIAFRVEPAHFADIVTRLRARGLAFGNDPEEPGNGRTVDPLGGAGRVYFVDNNGHLFEIVC
jgi:catechol 2,3-dioxygenase-like lactoylglutathione lyase family enzyme